MNQNSGFDLDESDDRMVFEHESTVMAVVADVVGVKNLENAPKNESSFLLLSEKKYCRICLEEENDDNDTTNSTTGTGTYTTTHERMIAPCLCKGSSKWVHRSCLDNWRMNEPDRAFAQCTECQFAYHFISSSTGTNPQSSSACRNQSRVKFCLFVSRDICTVTILLQLLIVACGYIMMLFDTKLQLGLTHKLYMNDKCNYDDNYESFWCRHNEVASYYLFGIFVVLAMIGMTGSIIFCRNGCRIPSFIDDEMHDDEIVVSEGDTTKNGNSTTTTTTTTATKAIDYDVITPVTNVPDIERGRKVPNDQFTALQFQNTGSTSQQFRHQQRHTTEYYRRQRHIHQHRSNTRCCSDDTTFCCFCCFPTGNTNRRTNASSSCSDRCNTANHYCVYTNCYPCDGPCCCDDCSNNSYNLHHSGGTNNGCCCCCPDHQHSASAVSMDSHNCNCDGGDNPMAVVLFMILVFFVVMAVIGLFLLLVIGVIVCQRIVQRYIFLLHKRTLVQEFQVADLSSSEYESNINRSNLIDNSLTDRLTTPFPCTLHENDIQRLQMLGLLNVKSVRES